MQHINIIITLKLNYIFSIPRSLFGHHPYLSIPIQLSAFPAFLQPRFCLFDLLQQIPGIAIGGQLHHQFATESFGKKGLRQLLSIN